MPEKPLEPMDVTVHDEPVFLRTGGTTTRTVLAFFVGDHGPFTEYFDHGEATPEKIKAAMDKRVALLKAIIPMRRA